MISGKEAMRRIKALKTVPDSSFGIIFYTCNLNTGECGEVRRYDKCRIRSAALDESRQVAGEHYLYFTDLVNEEPRQCWRVLIRKICFDGRNWLKINWLDYEQ